MSLIPMPVPILAGLNVSAVYERRYTTVDDVTHDEDHLHDFYELYVNLCGDVSFLVENRLYPIRKGDIIITRPNEIHRCIYHSDCIHEHFCIWFRGGTLSPAALDECFGDNTLVMLSEEDRAVLIDSCFGLFRNQREKGAAGIRAAKDFFVILDLIGSGKQGGMQMQNLPSSFTEVVDFILLHYAEPTCSVERICEEFFISKSTLLRRFRQYFQTTPSAYIESRRLSEAKKLLLAGQSVQNVCFMSGFSDCSYFILRFRKKFGMTPYRYQKDYMEPVSDIGG